MKIVMQFSSRDAGIACAGFYSLPLPPCSTSPSMCFMSNVRWFRACVFLSQGLSPLAEEDPPQYLLLPLAATAAAAAGVPPLLPAVAKLLLLLLPGFSPMASRPNLVNPPTGAAHSSVGNMCLTVRLLYCDHQISWLGIYFLSLFFSLLKGKLKRIFWSLSVRRSVCLLPWQLDSEIKQSFSHGQSAANSASYEAIYLFFWF